MPAGASGGRLNQQTMGIRQTTVSVTLVTHDSEAFLRRCLESVRSQDWPSLEVIVVDNQSGDGTRSILAEYGGKLRVIPNPENRGFAAAQNQAIRESSGEWILALNPDVVLAPDFVSRLVRGGSLDPRVGSVCGKLLRALPNFESPPERRLDSAGIYFTPTFRHFDRGFHRRDGEEYSRPAYVFGATAAAALYRRSMVEDVSLDGEFFDEDFFFYREDADVSWRAQLLGWRCLYLPEAVGHHVRRVFPGCRRALPDDINFHSVKNRFLMRIKNATLPLYLRNLVTVSVRDAGIVVYCLLVERSSLGAFPAVWRQWQRMLAKRRAIQQRRRVSDDYLQRWFRFRPVTVPVPASFGDLRETAAAAPKADARPVLPFPAAKAEPRRLPQL
jgi:GT2 family glycosyltransferase